MQHILTVNHYEEDNESLMMYPVEEWPEKEWQKLSDGGQMLADSDALTLVYVLDMEDEFVQLRIPKRVWPLLKAAHDNEKHVYVKNGSALHLENFHEEIDYLMDNVPGNGNYGTEMVSAFEEAFNV